MMEKLFLSDVRGRRQPLFLGFLPVDQPFHEIDIEGCIEEDGQVSVVDFDNADFFSVYVRVKDDEARFIADLPTIELAEQFVKTIKSLIEHGKAIS
jgi:hypothetical protein